MRVMNAGKATEQIGEAKRVQKNAFFSPLFTLLGFTLSASRFC